MLYNNFSYFKGYTYRSTWWKKAKKSSC